MAAVHRSRTPLDHHRIAELDVEDGDANNARPRLRPGSAAPPKDVQALAARTGSSVTTVVGVVD